MKPKVTLRCPANAYAGPNERIIEYSADGQGGLISFVIGNGKLTVQLYRHDATVEIRVSKPETGA